MKRTIVIALVAALLVGLSGCTYVDPIVNLLPDYKKKAFYTSGGWQDYTDYAKYYYEDIDAQTLRQTGRFREVTEEDIAAIMPYILDFENWVEVIGRDLKANYDFDKTTIRTGNFYFIKSKYENDAPEHKFWNYNVYYFDLDAQILYYFHSNI